MFRRVLWLIVVLVLGERAGAIELGDARDAVIAQYGAPAAATMDGLRIGYKWAGWKLDIEFSGDAAVQRLIFARDAGPLSTAESDQLLNEHGGRAAWQPAPDNDGSGGHAWVRSADGARAELDPGQREMTFVTPAWLAANTPQPAPPTRAQSRSIRIGEGFIRPNPTPGRAPMQPSAVLLVTFIMAACGISARRLLIVWGKKTSGRRRPAPSPRPAHKNEPSQFRTACEVDAPAAEPSPLAAPTPPERTLDALSPQQFELMIGEMYRRQGYRVEVCAGDGSDGGIDVTLRRGDEVVLVQCKHWRVFKVGVSTVREMYGVLTAEGAARVILVTTSVFTADARRFAAGKPIELVDGAALEAAIDRKRNPALCIARRTISSAPNATKIRAFWGNNGRFHIAFTAFRNERQSPLGTGAAER